ncbi:MAG TPA: hypothetical protein VKB86_18070, partial [Pyrinomonadaceae bacterium]|nr:hypothetical protein [Pyrinomonadaceae bacterium]
MSTFKKIFLILGVICCWLSVADAAYAQEPTGIHVKLSLADNKTVYRIGDPIKLVLEFTADSDGYQADTIPDRG